MRGTRISLLAVLALVGPLFGASPASAADPPGAVPLFTATSGHTPVVVEPLIRTANGVVWREPGNPNLGVGGAWGSYHTRLGGPAQAVGDLLSRYDSAAHTFVYETIRLDRTDHTVSVPADLTYLVSTSTGYLAERGTGPYELVSVDVLNGTDPVVFGTIPVSQTSLQASPLGALAQTDVAGQYTYFPYASPGAGQLLQTPPASTCTLTSTRLYCSWSDGTTHHLTRLPLTGEPGDQIDADVLSLVDVPGGAAFTWANGSTTTLSTWPLTDPAPATVPAAVGRITGALAPTTDSPSTVLVSHTGSLGDASIRGVSVVTGAVTLVATTRVTEPRAATDVAISPGVVAWADNGEYGGGVSVSDISGTTPVTTRLAGENATGGMLSVAGRRFTYTGGPAGGPLELGDAGSLGPLEYGGVVSQLSGDRLLVQTRVAGGGEPWTLRDLRTGTKTALPDALDYHLWGDRLARLDADGSVWVLDLRGGSAPEQMRAASPDVSGGTVQLAGDTVAWEITTAGPPATTELMTRNLATLRPAVPLPGLTQLSGLSTGYAVGSDCAPDGSCRTAAVPLAGGAATSFDGPPSGAGHSAAVDGSTLAFVSSSGIASLFALPAYADQPRLLGSPLAPPTVSAIQPWTARVLASRVLTSCQIQIRYATGILARALSCLDPHAAATVTWDGRNSVGALVPDGVYTWRIVGAADGLKLADYNGSAGALSGSVTVLPAVTGRSPAGDTNSVSQTANVTAAFSAPVTGVGSSTFLLRAPTGAIVPAVVSYDPLTQTATLDPTTTLAADTQYTATLIGGTTAIRDPGNRPPATQSWSFVTGPVPTVIAETPVNGTGPAVNANVTVTFSEPVQGVDATTFELEDYPAGRTVPATVTYNATTHVATLDPTADLVPDSIYYVSLFGGPTGIRDGAGNPLAYESRTFTSGPAPTVIARTPGINAVGVPINSNITATFSEPVQGVGPYQVVLTNPAGTKIPALVTYDATTRTATLNPTASLAPLVRYRMTIVGGLAGIEDMALNAMVTTSWTFTTGTR